MKKLPAILPLLAMLTLANCKTTKPLSGSEQQTASITKQGFIDCFEKGLTANGQPVWCEASAILYDGKNLFVANDKDMPDTRTSVFYWGYKNNFADTSSPAVYVNNPVLKYAKKFEDFAISPDGKTVFLSTGFDRIKPGSKDWDSYNTIYYWQQGKENEPQVLRQNDTDSSSVFLREKISKALTTKDFPEGMPYFKVEGFAVTNDQLYFGVREEGKKFDDFRYTVKIITATYHNNNGKISVDDDFKVLSDIKISNVPPFFKQPMGLSSIEYDRFNDRFLILTSQENGENFGGYLWTATLADLKNSKMTLVRTGSGSPVSFLNKSEDITVINKRKAIVIFDDDRVMSIIDSKVRQPHQAGYSVVEFK